MPKILYQGLVGSFQHLSAKKYFQTGEFIPVKNFVDVFDSLDKKLADFGIIAIENSLAGIIGENLNNLNTHSVHIVGEEISQIDHYLLGVSDITKVKKVFAHPMALLQCKNYLVEHKLEPVEFSNNATAAKMISLENNPEYACIASKEAGEIYNLKILDKQIQDNQENYTRMLILAPNFFNPEKFLSELDFDNKYSQDFYKLSIVFNLKHVRGSLANFLKELSELNLNLTMIQSKPIASKPFEYEFFVDAQTNTGNINNVLSKLHKSTEVAKLKILGIYKSSKF